jgi:hypothetical protein
MVTVSIKGRYGARAPSDEGKRGAPVSCDTGKRYFSLEERFRGWPP